MKNEIIEVYLDDEDGTTITYDVDECGHTRQKYLPMLSCS